MYLQICESHESTKNSYNKLSKVKEEKTMYILFGNYCVYLCNCSISNVKRQVLSQWGIVPLHIQGLFSMYHITGPLCGESIGHQWIPLAIIQRFDAFFAVASC